MGNQNPPSNILRVEDCPSLADVRPCRRLIDVIEREPMDFTNARARW